MFGDMMGKLQEARKMMDESKKRLDAICVDGEVENGGIRVTVTGNKSVKAVAIDPDLFQQIDCEALEELLVVAMNKALAEAQKVSDAEMKNAAGSMFPGMPGM